MDTAATGFLYYWWCLSEAPTTGWAVSVSLGRSLNLLAEYGSCFPSPLSSLLTYALYIVLLSVKAVDTKFKY